MSLPALPLPAAIDSALGWSEEFLRAPTMPLKAANEVNNTSTASAGSLPSMFASDLEGPAEPEVQKWEWTYEHLLRRGSDLPPLNLGSKEGVRVADTVLLSTSTELTIWIFSASDGVIKRKNSDKLTPQAVREAFEKAALTYAAFNTRGLTTAVRRSGAGATLLTESSMRDLTKESGDLSGIVALQLYIQGRGGNGTRYVCEYVRDRTTNRLLTTVHKRVYLGQADALGTSIHGNVDAPEVEPVAHNIKCDWGDLGERLGAATRQICRRVELHSRQTILHYNAQFILDENLVAWFIGGHDIITQRTPPPSVPRAERHVPINPTLQARVHGKLAPQTCMGDYCTLELRPAPSERGKKPKKKSGGRGKKDEPPEGSFGNLMPVEGGGGSLGDLLVTRDGDVINLKDALPKEERKRGLLPGLTFSTAAEEEEEAEGGGGRTSPSEDPAALPIGLGAAVQASDSYKGGEPTHRVAYRSILLDRTLRNMGIEQDDPAPPRVLLDFEARTRRRLDLYYKHAHVCANCARWYERLARQRASELDGANTPLEPLLMKQCHPSTRSSLPSVDEAASAGGDVGAAGSAPSEFPSGDKLRMVKSTSELMNLDAAPSSFARAMLRSSATLPKLQQRPPPPKPRATNGAASRRLGGIVAVS